MTGVREYGAGALSIPVGPTQPEPAAAPEAEAGDLNGRSVVPEAPSTHRASLTGEPSTRPATPSSSASSSSGAREWSGVPASSVAGNPQRLPSTLDKDLQRRRATINDDLTRISGLWNKHPEMRTAEIRDLEKKVRLGLQEGDVDSAQQSLDKLRDQTAPLRVLASDLDQVKHQVADLHRWKQCPASATKQLKEIDKHLLGRQFHLARAALSSLRAQIEPLHAKEFPRRYHDAQRARLRNKFDRFEPLAKRMGKVRPGVTKALDEYRAAREASRFSSRATPEQLDAARKRLARAGEALIAALTTRPAANANDAAAGSGPASATETELRKALEAVYEEVIAQASHTKPENLHQTLLLRRLTDTSTAGTKLNVAQKKVVAHELLGIGGDGVAPGRPAAPDEKRYFRALHSQYALFDGLSKYASCKQPTMFSSAALTPDEAEAWARLSATLGTLPGMGHDTVADEEAKLQRDPARYTNACQTLERAVQQANEMLDVCRRGLSTQIAALDNIADPEQRRSAALQIVEDVAAYDKKGVVLSVLESEQHLTLLDALRRGQSMRDLPEAVRTAQSKIYKATRLDHNFRAEEKRVRREVVKQLMENHGYELQRARDEWPRLSDDEKIRTMWLVTDAYCKVAGFEPPREILFAKEDSGTYAFWENSTRRLVINPKHAGLNDFESMMDTVFHENSHNWQQQLSDGLKNPGQMGPEHPLYRQARLFDSNRAHYESDARASVAYEEQPMEAHAFMAGRKFARDLTRALASQET